MISSIPSPVPVQSNVNDALRWNRNPISELPTELVREIFSFSNLKDLYAMTRVCRGWNKVSDMIKPRFEIEKAFESFRVSQSELTSMRCIILMTRLEKSKLSLILGDPRAVILGNQIACVVPYKHGENGVSLVIKVARYYKKTMLDSVNYLAHFDNNSLSKVKIRFNSRNVLQIVLEKKIVNFKIVNSGALSPEELKLVPQPSRIKTHRSDSSLTHSRLVTHYDHKRLFMTHDPVGAMLDSIKVVEDNGGEYELPVPNSSLVAVSVRMKSLNDHLLVGYNFRHEIKLCLYDLKTRSLVHERNFQDIGEDERNDIKYLIPDHFFCLGNDSLYIRTVNGLSQRFHQIDPNSLETIDSCDAMLEQEDECVNFKVIDNVCILVIRNKQNLFLQTLDLDGKRNCRLTLKDNSTFYDASIIHSNYLAIKTLQKEGLSFDIAFFCPRSMKILFQTEFKENHFVSLVENPSLAVKNGSYIVYRGGGNAQSGLLISNQAINKLSGNSKPQSLKGKVIRLSIKLISIARFITGIAALTLAACSFALFCILTLVAIECKRQRIPIPLKFHACVLSTGLFSLFSSYIAFRLC